jgi:hypothetical protein
MSKRIQLRRGTTAETNAFTGAVGEVTVDTDKKTVVVHDGTTVGGTPLAREADLNNLMVQYLPMPYPKSTPPVGHLVMMGQTIDQVTYPILFSLYGGTLPDMRGLFMRVLDYGRGVDSGRTVLSFQQDEIKSHNHSIPDVNVIEGGGSIGFQGTGYQFSGKYTNLSSGVETRPKNIAFLYIVKAG